MSLRATILGCGSSGGVPRLGGVWGACDPDNPKNTRRRCSLLVEQESAQGTTRVLIDTGPDLRAQLLDTNTGYLDGVVWTHEHADHVHGLDDLRMIVMNRYIEGQNWLAARLPVWADARTSTALFDRFGYVFETPPGSAYPPILDHQEITGPFEVYGDGGPIPFTPLPVDHGSIEALGFRIKNLAYVPDVVEISEGTLALMEGLDCLIIDALRYKPHPTHAHVERTLGWIERLKPARAVLTNMHIDLDYETLAAETPAHVEPAYDGLVITLP
ncbi:MBL fold metallo-hydrolase [Paracoccaceae bacterium GXU_MW_L88]